MECPCGAAPQRDKTLKISKEKIETKMKYRILALTLLFNSVTYSQLHELKIGDTVPDIEITNIVNYPQSKIKMSELRGKTVILDFWSKWCAPCIEGLPDMENIQNEFKNEVVILPVWPFLNVTNDEVEEVKKFWSENKTTSKLSLPTVVDTTLRRMFDFSVGYQVWIDKHGVYRARTSDEYVNSKELSKFNSGTIPNWEIATKEFYNFEIPLFKKCEASFNSLKYYSFVSGYMKQTQSGKRIIIDSSLDRKRFTCINFSIIGLYKELLLAKKLPLTFLKVESKKQYSYFKNGYYNEWLRTNGYCYEISLPLKTTDEEMFESIRLDLNRYLGLNGRFEIRPTTCYIIKPLTASATKFPVDEFEKDGSASVFSTIDELVNAMNQINISLQVSPPVIAEGDFSKRAITIKLPPKVNLQDIETIKKGLNKVGYDIQKETKLLNVFLISDLSMTTSEGAK